MEACARAIEPYSILFPLGNKDGKNVEDSNPKVAEPVNSHIFQAACERAVEPHSVLFPLAEKLLLTFGCGAVE